MLTARVTWFTAFCIISLVEVCHEGHAIVQVSTPNTPGNLAWLQFRPLEFYTLHHASSRTTMSDTEMSQSCYGACFIKVERGCMWLRCACPRLAVPTTTSSATLFVMAQPPMRPDPVGGSILREVDRGHERQEQEEKSASGSISGPSDPRDPRMQKIWPCYGNHVEGTWQKNPHGAWNHCQVCNLRLGYIPRSGSPGTNTFSVNPAMVTRMLTELEALLQGARPTAKICKAMMDKIEAEVVLEKLVVDLKDKKRTTTSRRKAETGYATPSASSADWEKVTTKGTPETRAPDVAGELSELLSVEEHQKLMEVLTERRAAQSMPMTLDAAYRAELDQETS